MVELTEDDADAYMYTDLPLLRASCQSRTISRWTSSWPTGSSSRRGSSGR